MKTTITGNTGNLRKWGLKLRAAVRTTPRITAALGAAAVVLMVTRTVKGMDVDGRQFKPYSTRPVWVGGEYYSLASGAGGRTKYLESRAEAGKYTGKMRSKRHGSRFIRFVGNAEDGGIREVRDVKKGFKGQRKTSVMKTVAFPSYANFKTGLGHSALPDLQVSGKMTGGLGQPVPFGSEETGDDYVVIGFFDPEQKRKAEGVNSLREWWGVGRTKDERDKLQTIIDLELIEQIRAEMHGSGS